MSDDELVRLLSAASPPPPGLRPEARVAAVLARLPQPVLPPWFAAALAASLVLGILAGHLVAQAMPAGDEAGEGLVLFAAGEVGA